MSDIQFSVQVISDKFIVFGSNSSSKIEVILPKIYEKIRSGGYDVKNNMPILIAQQMISPEMLVDELNLAFGGQSLSDIEWRITNPNITLEKLGVEVVDDEEDKENMRFKFTNPQISLQDLNLRPTNSLSSLEDYKIQSGYYLLFIKPAGTTTKLSLFLPNETLPEWTCEGQEEFIIGRRDKKNNPFIDLTDYLRNPLIVSRKSAILREEKGRWTIHRHPECHVKIFVNEMALKPGMKIEIDNDTKIIFGGNPYHPEISLRVCIVAN